ncbi:MAG: multidrug effflux MFS transporter [Putridiphycobacter sp.]|nr:multidrug effflux MFS transporter [Putridiphycobacter sp.]
MQILKNTSDIRTVKTKSKPKSELEFIALMAFLMANAALAIDTVLPGLGGIGESLNVSTPNHLQLIIIMILVGLGVGQLFFGTLSDSFGRKPMVYAGIITFIIASVVCVLANSLEVMLIGRVLQGIGLSAPRSISVSIIRDSYKGDRMARVMSFIAAIFIIVPMVAPLIGQFILNHYTWPYIFGFQIVFILLVLWWFVRRQEETLKIENKKKFTRSLFNSGAKVFFSMRSTVVYTLISGFIGGSFFVYLSASQQVFQNQYALGEQFAYVFGTLALSLGVASFLNSSLVLRFGMRKLSTFFLVVFCASSLLYAILFSNSGNPSLAVVMVFFAIQFLSLGFIFGNIRSLAMEPIGHIAGIGAAINGFLSTLLSVPIAIFIGSFI